MKENKIGVINILGYSIAILLLTIILDLAVVVLSFIFYHKIMPLQIQFNFSAVFYIITYIINLPVLLTTDITKEK